MLCAAPLCFIRVLYMHSVLQFFTKKGTKATASTHGNTQVLGVYAVNDDRLAPVTISTFKEDISGTRWYFGMGKLDKNGYEEMIVLNPFTDDMMDMTGNRVEIYQPDLVAVGVVRNPGEKRISLDEMCSQDFFDLWSMADII